MESEGGMTDCWNIDALNRKIVFEEAGDSLFSSIKVMMRVSM